MTILRPSACLACLMVFGFTGCNSVGRQEPISATLFLDGSDLAIEIRNNLEGEALVDKGLALSGPAGGGNLLLLPIGENGILYRACSNIDYSGDFKSAVSLSAGASTRSDLIEADLLKALYCLSPGKYEVSALYFDRRGHRVTTNVVTLQVKNGVGKTTAQKK